jgi:hypothetical protein
VVSGRRSFVEVVGLSKSPEDECFPAYNEPITRVPRWLKEALAALKDQKLAKVCGGREKFQSKTHSQTGPVQVPTKTHS